MQEPKTPKSQNSQLPPQNVQPVASRNAHHDAAEVKRVELQIGPYRVHAVPTGVFGLDGGAMFGTVPKVLWERTNPADEQNRIKMEARAMLLVSDQRRILIDCGIGGDFIPKYGEKLGNKFAEIYAVSTASEGALGGALGGASGVEKSLNSYGLKLTDITDVVLTHLHFDHAGGATCEKDGKLVPTFPNARYYVQRANYNTAVHPNVRERASYYSANFNALMDAGVLTLLDGSQADLLPGVSVIVSNGHTEGQQMVKVSDGASTLVYCADVIPTSTHVKLAWVMGYDLHPLQLIQEKRELLGPAAEHGWYLFFEHDPYIDLAKVQSSRDDFALAERLQLV